MTRVRAERGNGVGRLVLSRPEKKNALDRAMADELHDALTAFGADDAVRVVLLQAEGRDFCAGADLAALEAMLDADREAHLQDAQALGRVFTAMRQLPQPVVAAVRGRALAGGAGLATACDIVVAGESAELGFPEMRIGFVPAMVMTMLRRCVGEKQAFDLIATGRRLTAREALAIGLVSRVVADAELDGAAETLAAELAAAPPVALRMTKRLFYDLDGLDFAHGISLGAHRNADARATDDFAAGVRAFLTRRGSGGSPR